MHVVGATLIARAIDDGKEDLGIGDSDRVVDDGSGKWWKERMERFPKSTQ
jgi:hypothetical protein